MNFDIGESIIHENAVRLWCEVYASFYGKFHNPKLAKQAADHAVEALLAAFCDEDEG